jgi:hypothetical protein
LQAKIEDLGALNEMCYELFIKNSTGAKFLELLEKMYFYKAVAHPGRDVCWAYWFEGRNELIRSFRTSAEVFMNEKPKTDKTKKVIRERN